MACRVVTLVAVWFASPAWAEPPDFSGVWTPDVNDQKRQEIANLAPWRPEVRTQIQHMFAEEKAGRPFLVLSHCLPHGMPSWTLMTHNAFELLTTPGRITMLGEVDGNRMRRIYTDGRPHPEDPDLSLHGHSIGHWDGETLVVDTVAIMPQAYIAKRSRWRAQQRRHAHRRAVAFGPAERASRRPGNHGAESPGRNLEDDPNLPPLPAAAL